jgi:hypothetical protein
MEAEPVSGCKGPATVGWIRVFFLAFFYLTTRSDFKNDNTHFKFCLSKVFVYLTTRMTSKRETHTLYKSLHFILMMNLCLRATPWTPRYVYGVSFLIKLSLSSPFSRALLRDGSHELILGHDFAEHVEGAL